MRKTIRNLSIVVIIMSMLLAACSSTNSQPGENKPGQAAPSAITQPPANSTSSTIQAPTNSSPAATQAPTNSSPVATQAQAISTPAATQADLMPPDQVQALFSQLINSLPVDINYGYIHPDVLNADLNYPNKPFLVDVRDPEEVTATGYIAGAVNIPLRGLLTNLDELPTPDTSIVIYSNSGYRSGMALAALTLLGYTNVHDLDGGLHSWEHNYQLPVVTGLTQPSPSIMNPQPVISDQATYNMLNAFLSSLPNDYYQVDPVTLSNELRNTTPPTLIDMNTSKDHAQYGQIQGAISMPYAEFFNDLNMLPSKDSPIVIYAVGGGHSSIMVMALREMGYTNVTSLKGGILAWIADNLPVQSGG